MTSDSYHDRGSRISVDSSSSEVTSHLPSIRCTVGVELDTPLPESEEPGNFRSIVPKLHVPGHSELLLDNRKLTVYDICGKQYTMQAPVENETVTVFKRTTINGRTLSYRLKVIQEPAKARACGNGPRSSADRRPVDPPPVVKLTIYEGDKDITQSYEAGFVLYAGLEFARPIAYGRMHQNAHVYPVLTGVCVAGPAYLQRPKNAAYFIFPDLSVRHEGWYRLKFHLFEQIKYRDDADPDRPFVESLSASDANLPEAPKSHENMANRTFVYSAPFQVFSAKKFPGLNTSTELSKIVADQGCRVRIRRDIRQRRQAKKSKDEEELRSMHGTPGSHFSHERSHSRESLDRRPIPGDLARRMSIDSQGYHSTRQPSMDHTSPLSSTAHRPSLPRGSPVAQSYNPGYHPMAAPHRSYTPLPQHSMAAPSQFNSAATSPREQPLPSLPGIQSLINATRAPTMRGGYTLPEPTPVKRQHRVFECESALKDGARPSTEMPQPRKSDIASVLNFSETVVIANDEDSDSSDSVLDGCFTYKRADGNVCTIPPISRRYMSRF